MVARECCHQVRYSTGVVLLDCSDSNLTVDESSDGLAIMSSLPPAGRVGRVIGRQQPPVVRAAQHRVQIKGPGHKFFCIGFCLAFSVCQSGFRGLPQDMAVPSPCLRRDFPKKVKSIFSYGIARPLEKKLRMNCDA